MAGLALVTCFGLLGVRQTRATSILLAVQSSAVAISALVQHQPFIAAATAVVDVAGAQWFINRQRFGIGQTGVGPAARGPRGATSAKPSGGTPAAPDRQGPAYGTGERPDGGSGELVGGAKLCIFAGCGLTVLCQSCGPLALPLAIVLLSILLAATRPYQLTRLVPLVSLQNGIALGACSAAYPPLAGLVCFALPLLFAVGLATGETAGRHLAIPRSIRTWLGWVQLAVTIGFFAATLAIPLKPLAAVFAPLIGAWGIADAWGARNRVARNLTRRGAVLVKLACMLLAVGATHPVVAWFAVLGAVAAALFPIEPRRWNGALLAFSAAGLSLFGLLTMPVGLPLVSYAALFIGYAAITAVVPDLGVVLLILILRQTTQAHLPQEAGSILAGLATLGLLACAVLLTVGSGFPARGSNRNRTTLLQLGQTSIVAIALGLGLPEARFAAVVLLIQLILTCAAVRISDGPVANAARAGLGGIPPFGVFPGLVLVLLVIGDEAPWLLLPSGLGLAAMLAASVRGPFAPRHAPARTWRDFRSAGIVPLALAFALGFFAPDRLVTCLHAVAAGIP